MSAIPEPKIIQNDDSSKTVISFKIQDGKKYKVTQKVKEITVTEKVNKNIAMRRNWKKYGADKGSAPGPDISTTQLGEELELELSPNWKENEEEKAKEKAANSTQKVITCRICGGAHFTMHCPYKDTLGKKPTTAAGLDPAIGGGDMSVGGGSGPGKYVPPSLRAGARDPSSNAYLDQRERDDAKTIRLTQVNELADEEVLKRELLFPFGEISRVFVVKNPETGRSRGVAYVTFQTEEIAAQALKLLDGRGFMNFMLHAEWSKPKPKKEAP